MNFDFNNTLFNLQIYDYMLSQYQGKHAYYTILSQLNSGHFKSGDLIFTDNAVTKTYNAKKDLVTNNHIVLYKNNPNETLEAKSLLSSLKQLSMDILAHAETLTPVIESANYFSDQERVNLLLASYGWICYQRLHLQLCNFDSVSNLNLTETIPSIQARIRQAKAIIDEYDGFVQLFLSKQIIPQEVYIQFWEIAILTDVIMKYFAHDIDQFLIFTSKETFEYSDYKFMLPGEISEWEALKVDPILIGYWKACDFTPKDAAPWIHENFADPLFCKTCQRFKISLENAKIGVSLNIPLSLIRRWQNVNVPLQEAVQRMKNGEMPPIIPEGERML